MTLEMTPQIWQVGALCRAVANVLEARLNPVVVMGEVSGFLRASSGHCYFSLKDQAGQLRCVMFRRAAGLIDFRVADGDKVEARGRLAVYEQRGELQLVVESARPVGQGALFEQFLRLKARLEVEGLFQNGRKRLLPPYPRGIGLVTSLGAAALHDVVAALRRRVPHIPVVLATASVQGNGAPGEIEAALTSLYAMTDSGPATGASLLPELAANMHGQPVASGRVIVDVVLLVRGGGSIEDLWAFNDERVARAIVASPVPVVTGIGHEVDFSIADFCADLRAPTPTAAAELVTPPREELVSFLTAVRTQLCKSVTRQMDGQTQRLDGLEARLGRRSTMGIRQRMRVTGLGQRLQHVIHLELQGKRYGLDAAGARLSTGVRPAADQTREVLARLALRHSSLDPKRVLARGYAWLCESDGKPVTRAGAVSAGQALRAVLVDGALDLKVTRSVSAS